MQIMGDIADYHLEQIHGYDYTLPYTPPHRYIPTMAKKRPAKKRPTKKKSSKRKVNKSDVVVPWKRPLALIIYAQSGLGKTSFASAFPDPVFIIDPNEQGIIELVEEGQVKKPKDIIEVQAFTELESIGDRAEEFAEDGVQTVVFDSLTGLEYLCFDQFCEEEYDGDWSKEGFMSYQQGPASAAKSLWPRFLKSTNSFIQAGLNVIMIAHSQVKSFNDPMNPSYDKFTPYLHKETWQQTHRWASMVLFMNMEVQTTKEGGKTKALENGLQRNVYTEPSPLYDAKHRHGLEPVFETGSSHEECFENFINAFPG